MTSDSSGLFGGIDAAAQSVAKGMQVALRTTAVNAEGVSSPVSFTVAIDQLPALKTAFQQAQDELRAGQDKAKSLTHVPSPGLDHVSVDGTNKLAAAANEDQGNLGWALTEGIAAYQGLIDQCDATIKNYRTTEDSAAQSFRST